MTAVTDTNPHLSESALYDGFCRGQAQLTELFAQCDHLGPAVEPALDAVGSALGWACVQLWAQQPDGCLSMLDSWSPLGSEALEFQRASWQVRMARGEGAPGRALERETPVWIADITQDSGVLSARASAAAADGIGALLEIPIEIQIDDEPTLFHIMELAAPGPALPDPELLEMTQTLCSQLTQFATMRHYAHMAEHTQPIAIHEEIVGPLELAFQALETGDVDHAASLVHHTIVAAKRLAGPS